MMSNKETELTSRMEAEDQQDGEEGEAEQGFAFTTSGDIEQDDERKFSYTRSVVRVTKSTLAQYMIWNKCICLFMIWMHLTMGLLSLILSRKMSEVSSESTMCRYIFYSSHYLYGYINLAIAALYTYLFSTFSLRAIRELQNSDWISLFFVSLFGYVLMLKLFADLNCTFWSISLRQIILQSAQFALEGVLIRVFYGWLNLKTSVLRDTLESNVDFIAAHMIDKTEAPRD